jgi:hypothetical protein
VKVPGSGGGVSVGDGGLAGGVRDAHAGTLHDQEAVEVPVSWISVPPIPEPLPRRTTPLAAMVWVVALL